MYRSYAAIGDSFTEGVGDELADGTTRGWADLVAVGLARAAAPEPVGYANLAIRGRRLTPIVAEQVDAAVALGAELVSFNGGGNDLLRPRVTLSQLAEDTWTAVERLRAGGAHVLLLSGGNPADHLPLGGVFDRRGAALTAVVAERGPVEGVTFVDNFSDRGLRDSRYWSIDRLHLNALGHARVAANVLTALDVPVPPEWGVAEVAQAPAGQGARRTAGYYRRYVLPWVGRRVTGRSTGDGRSAKRPSLEPVALP